MTQWRGCTQVNYGATGADPKGLGQDAESVDFTVWVIHTYGH